MKKEYYKKVEMKDWMDNQFFDDWSIQKENGLCPEKIKGRKPFKVAFLSFMMRVQTFSEVNQKRKPGFSVTIPAVSFWFGGRMSGITVRRYYKFFEDYDIMKVVCKYSFKDSQHLCNLYRIDFEKAYEWLKDYAGVTHVDLDISKMYEFFDAAKKYNTSNKIKEVLEVMTEEEKAEFFEEESKKEEKEKKKANKFKKDNAEFLKILASLNGYGLELRYLNDGSKRLNSRICSTKNEKHIDSTRISEIQKLWNTDKNIVEFDTNASIYRLSYLLGHQTLCSHDVDIYEEIFKMCGFSCDNWSETRSDFKKLFMPIYMRESSIRWTSDNYDFMKNWTYFVDYRKKDQTDFYRNLLAKLHCDNLYEVMDRVRNAMKDYLNMNRFERANIFIHESNLHILMLKRFQDLGLKVINVYDGFYFEEGKMTQNLFDSVYDECSIELLNIMKAIEGNKQKHAKRNVNKARAA